MSLKATAVLFVAVALTLGLVVAGRCVAFPSAEGLPSVGLVVALDADGDSLDVGNGFLLSSCGHFVTTLSTVVGAASVKVTFPDGEVVESDGVAAVDHTHNLALLALDACEESASCGDAKLHPALVGSALRMGDHVQLIGSPIAVAQGPVAAVVNGTEQTTAGGAFYLVSGSTRAWSLGAMVVRGDRVVGIASMAPSSQSGAMRVAPVSAVAALLESVGPDSAMTFAAIGEDDAMSPSRIGLPELESAAVRGVAIGEVSRAPKSGADKVLTFLAVALFAATGVETIRSLTE